MTKRAPTSHRLLIWAIIGVSALVLAPQAEWTRAAADPVRSATVPDDDEPKNPWPEKPPTKAAPAKPAAAQKRRNGTGYIQPGPDGIVRTDPVVEPGDPGYVGPLPPPRPRPKPPEPEPEPPAPEPPKPEPKPPVSPPVTLPVAPPATPPAPTIPAPPKYVPPKPVLVPEPGDNLPPQPPTQPQPSQPSPQPPKPEPPKPEPPKPQPPKPQPGQEFIPPEAFPEPSSPAPQPQPTPEPPKPEPPKPEPPTPTPAPTPQPDPPPAAGPIDSGLSDVTGRAFTYFPPGDLKPGSGSGVRSNTVFAPGMRYPIETAPSFPNSQVYGRGGYLGPGGGLCDQANYVYPWRDNFCEKRGWQTPACPGGRGHQGQDIRAMDCKNAIHWVVAVEDGVITKIGGWSVNLKGISGREYIYLHMRMSDLRVEQGTQVRRGQRIGKVSNDFGGSPTSIHLHFEIRANVALPGQPAGFRKVPPYASLVDAYKRLLRGQP